MLCRNTDHLEVVAILEMFVTRLAIILVMAFSLHMLLGGSLGVKLDGTNLARKPWCPMIQGIHMLLDCVRVQNGTRACKYHTHTAGQSDLYRSCAARMSGHCRTLWCKSRTHTS